MKQASLHQSKVKILNELIFNSELLILNTEENRRESLLKKRNTIFGKLKQIDRFLEEENIPKVNPLIQKKIRFLDELQQRLLEGMEEQKRKIADELSKLNSQNRVRNYLVR